MLLGEAIQGGVEEQRLANDIAIAQKVKVNEDEDDEMKVLEEYEKAQKLAESQKNEMMKKLEEETANLKLNEMKVFDKWRNQQRKTKSSELRGNIEILKENQKREVKLRDNFIQSIQRDQENMEKFFSTAQQTHIEKVDELLTVHEERMISLEKKFEEDLKATEERFRSERDALTRRGKLELQELSAIIEEIQSEENEVIEEAKQNYETEKEEIINNNLDVLNVLKVTLGAQIEELEKRLDDSQSEYLEETREKMEQFQNLEAQDFELSKSNEQTLKKIENFQSELTYWKEKLAQNDKEYTQKNALLKGEKDAISQHYFQLKNEMDNFRSAESRRLTDLSLMSRKAIEENKKKLDRAEKILKVVEFSRRLETEKEKVQSFYKSQTEMVEEERKQVLREMEKEKGIVEGEKQEMGEQQEEEEEERCDEAVIDGAQKNLDSNDMLTFADNRLSQLDLNDEWSYLENFNRRYNTVLLDKVRIDQEKDKLQQENLSLKVALKQYVDGTTVTSDAVDGVDNTLLIVKGRVN